MEKLLKTLDSDLVLIKAVVGEETIELHAKRDTVEETCPYCGAKSKSVHSVYPRTISDLPIQEKMVKIIIHKRLFFCRNPDCNRPLFSETLSFVDKYGRRTNRLTKKIKEIAMNMSARSAKKVVNKGISNDTIQSEGYDALVRYFVEEPVLFYRLHSLYIKISPPILQFIIILH